MGSINALRFGVHSYIDARNGFGNGDGEGAGYGYNHGYGFGLGLGDGYGDIYGHGDSQRDYGCFDNGYGDAEGYDGG